MITSRFPLGDVSFSAEYFSTLVGEATKQCYGVAAMTPRDLTDVVKSVVRGNDYSEKGVRVTQEEGRLVIELHIAVSYGLNISTDTITRATFRPVACSTSSLTRCEMLRAAVEMLSP